MAKQFQYTAEELNHQTLSLQTASVHKPDTLSEFDQLICRGWSEALEKGHFRYTLDEMKTRVVPGRQGYVLQLNLKRGTERRKPEYIESLSQPYDPNKFNFTKVKKDEILCELCPHHSGDMDGVLQEQIVNGQELNGARMENGATAPPSHHLVLINVSPLEYGHILLVPDVDSQIPQKLSLRATRIGLEMLLLSAHPGWRVGFNSLCALASVNHQHLHAWYLEKSISIEYAQVHPVCKGMYELVGMPTRALAFQLHGSSVTQMARDVFLAVNYLQENDVAHNVYMTRGPVFGQGQHSHQRTVRVYVWPRKSVVAKGLMDAAVFNVAVAELAGHVPMYAPDQYDSLTEDYINNRLQEQMFSQERFNYIKDSIKSILIQNSH